MVLFAISYSKHTCARGSYRCPIASIFPSTSYVYSNILALIAICLIIVGTSATQHVIIATTPAPCYGRVSRVAFPHFKCILWIPELVSTWCIFLWVNRSIFESKFLTKQICSIFIVPKVVAANRRPRKVWKYKRCSIILQPHISMRAIYGWMNDQAFYHYIILQLKISRD